MKKILLKLRLVMLKVEVGIVKSLLNTKNGIKMIDLLLPKITLRYDVNDKEI